MSNSYEVVPANSHCQNIVNKNVIEITPGTPVAQTTNNLNNIQQQNAENTRFDNINSYDVKPLHGGGLKISKDNSKNKNKIFIVKFMKNNYEYTTSSKKKALKYFLDNLKEINSKNRNSKDSLIEIYEKNNKSNNLLYILV
jgi:hypothetical protein